MTASASPSTAPRAKWIRPELHRLPTAAASVSALTANNDGAYSVSS